MVTDPRFDAETFQAEPAERKKSGWSTCLTGCLIALVVMAVVAVVAGVWIARNWRGWAASFGSQGIKQMVDGSQLPVQEKQEINVQVDRVADEFRAGRLSKQQLSTIKEKLVDSPLMTSFVAAAVEAQYFEKSGLSDDEKAEGKRTLRRFLRGTIDDEIDEQSLDAAMAHVADRDSNGQWQLRQRVSDADLRAFLAAAKARADEAGVAEEPEDFDPSDEIKRIIDEAMGEA